MSHHPPIGHPTCQIQWIDQHGHPTPDQRPAIGRVRRRAHTQMILGRSADIPESEWFYICDQHAARLTEPGMRHWEFIPLDSDPPDSNAHAA